MCVHPNKHAATNPVEYKTDAWIASLTSRSICCASSIRGRASASDHCPLNALCKVEKILWMGRDSLNLFSSSRSASDRRNNRAEPGGVDAVQGSPILLILRVSSPPQSQIDKCDTCLSHSLKLPLNQHPGLATAIQPRSPYVLLFL